MNDRSKTVGKGRLAHAVRGLFQSSCRCFRREEGSAFARNMEARKKAEAYYTMPMPRF